MIDTIAAIGSNCVRPIDAPGANFDPKYRKYGREIKMPRVEGH